VKPQPSQGRPKRPAPLGGSATGPSGGTSHPFCRLPARVYHLAEASNWPAIQREGLHCASTLLDRAGIVGKARRRWEQEQRPEHAALPNGAWIRDQRPMPPDALARCLVDMTPAQWYALINGKVFFWFDPARLNRQRAACSSRPQVVLTVDALRLAETYADRVALTPFNTGNARRRPATRGGATFVPFRTWLDSGWATEAALLGIRERSRSHPPVEFTVSGSIPDILTFAVDVRPLAPGQSFAP